MASPCSRGEGDKDSSGHGGQVSPSMPAMPVCPLVHCSCWTSVGIGRWWASFLGLGPLTCGGRELPWLGMVRGPMEGPGE